MNRKKFKSEISNIFEDCLLIIDKKNSDYANSEDAFKNFKFCEIFNITSTEQGILVRSIDKMSRIVNLLDHNPHVKEEQIEDTIKDLINYMAILLVYLKGKK